MPDDSLPPDDGQEPPIRLPVDPEPGDQHGAGQQADGSWLVDSQDGIQTQPAGGQPLAGEGINHAPRPPQGRRRTGVVYGDSESGQQPASQGGRTTQMRFVYNRALGLKEQAFEGLRRRAPLYVLTAFLAGGAAGYFGMPWLFSGSEDKRKADIAREVSRAVTKERKFQKTVKDAAVQSALAKQAKEHNQELADAVSARTESETALRAESQAAIESALEGHISDFERALRANPSRTHPGGFEVYFADRWYAHLDFTDTLEIKARDHVAKTPVDYSTFLVDKDRYNRIIRQAAQDITQSGETFEEKASMILDFFRMQMTEEETPEAPEGIERSYVKYPIETLVDRGGTNEDLAILGAAMIRSLGADVMLFYFAPTDDKPSHLSLGVAGDFQNYRPGDNMLKASVSLDGKDYYFFEPRDYDHNKDCFFIGDVPKEIIGRNSRMFRVTADY